MVYTKHQGLRKLTHATQYNKCSVIEATESKTTNHTILMFGM
jgi:hypothetical protein